MSTDELLKLVNTLKLNYGAHVHVHIVYKTKG